MKTKVSKLSLIYFFLITCIFPLFLTNYYYNVQLSKSLFFLITTYLTFIGVIIIAPRQTFSPINAALSLRRSSTFLSLSAFILSTLISALLSPYTIAAFTGSFGRYIGFFFILSMGICFLLFATIFTDLQSSSVFLFLGGSLTALLGILQFVQIDPLGLSIHIPEYLSGNYLSTIGHINTFSSYISMTTAFCVASYCLNGKHVLFLPSLIGFVALFAGNSDTGFMCIGAVFVLLFFFLKEVKEVIRLFDQFVLFACACIIGYFLSFRGLIPYQGFPALFCRPEIALCLTLLILTLRLTTGKLLTSETGLRKLKSICMTALISLISVFLILLVLVNLRVIEFSPLLLDDNWGSFRGYIWRKVLEVYRDAPLLNKLFGYGPDTLKPLLLNICREEMISVTTKIYDSAHNDFLQYLITTGCFGAISWLAFWSNVLLRTIKAKNKIILPWLAVLVAYLVQTIFIPTQPITAPLGFMVAGICIGRTRE